MEAVVFIGIQVSGKSSFFKERCFRKAPKQQEH